MEEQMERMKQQEYIDNDQVATKKRTRPVNGKVGKLEIINYVINVHRRQWRQITMNNWMLNELNDWNSRMKF